MKDFFKTLFASCLGVILAIFALFFVLFAIGAASASMFGGQATEASDGFLTVELDHYLPEQSGNVESQQFSLEQNVTVGLREVTRLIKNAETDSNIKGLVIKADYPMNGGATLLALSNAVQEFKKTDKPVYAYINTTSKNGYMLASIADKVVINPNGEILLNGYGVTSSFIKGMTDKLGIKFNIFYAGDFKSATEPLRRTDMSPESKQQTREFLNEYLNEMQTIVCRNRKMTKAKLDEVMINLDGRNPKLALASGLVDAIGYQDEFEASLRDLAKMSKSEKINFISLDKYSQTTTLKNGGSYSKKIAIVYAEGSVVYGSNNKGEISDQKYIKTLAKLRNDDNVKAVVLRVNSGGGSAYTSDVIWREIELLKKAGKPVVASFGDYAASGGYYIAAGANKIFAEPNTLTGSIGVFSIIPNTKDLMNNKLGITFDTVQTLPNSIFVPLNFDLSAKDSEVLNEMTANVYEQFVRRVADGRKMSLDSVKIIARGRVWTGKKGVEIGLVDKLGSLDDAIAEAAKLAKVEGYKIAEYPYIKKDPLQEILKTFAASTGGDDEARVSTSPWYTKLWNGNELHFLKTLIENRRENAIQARIPFTVE